MKIKLSFPRFLTLLTALLTFGSFSCFSVVTAQNDSVEFARSAAEADAEADTNMFLWASMGCGAAAIATPLFISSFETDDKFVYMLSTCLLFTPSLVGIYYAPSPPASRFIGKPPQYVQAYTTAYKRRKSSMQAITASYGGIIGALIGGLGWLYFQL